MNRLILGWCDPISQRTACKLKRKIRWTERTARTYHRKRIHFCAKCAEPFKDIKLLGAGREKFRRKRRRRGGAREERKKKKKKKESSKPRSAVRKSVGSGKTKEETRLNLPSLCSRLVGCSKEPFYASGTKEFDKVKSKWKRVVPCL